MIHGTRHTARSCWAKVAAASVLLHSRLQAGSAGMVWQQAILAVGSRVSLQLAKHAFTVSPATAPLAHETQRQPPWLRRSSLPVCTASAGASSSSQEQISCEVCMSDCKPTECSSNECGHTFCNNCWRSHLAVQIQDGKARHISCMAYKCGVVCDEDLILQVMKARRQCSSMWGSFPP